MKKTTSYQPFRAIVTRIIIYKDSDLCTFSDGNDISSLAHVINYDYPMIDASNLNVDRKAALKMEYRLSGFYYLSNRKRKLGTLDYRCFV